MNEKADRSGESSEVREVGRHKLVKTIKEMMAKAQIRRLIIYNENGKTVLDLKFGEGITMALLLTLVLPKVFALVLVAPLLAGFKIQIIRHKVEQIDVAPQPPLPPSSKPASF